MESVHHLMKVVAGAPNIRPPWFFDTAEQGEGASDIGTHLVDLVQWTLFPDQAIDYRADIRVLAAQRWPTWIPEADFRRVTGTARFPDSVAGVGQGRQARVLLQHALLLQPARRPHEAERDLGLGSARRGRRHALRLLQGHARAHRGAADEGRSLSVRSCTSCPPAPTAEGAGARRRAGEDQALQRDFPGVGVEDRGAEIHITIPDPLRVSHEAHFAQVTANFLRYLRDRSTLPAWERPNMLAKYYVTTKGAELSRQSPPRARLGLLRVERSEWWLTPINRGHQTAGARVARRRTAWNRPTLERILADDFIISGWQPEGRLAGKQFYIDDCMTPVELESGSIQFNRWQFRIYGETVVVNCILDIRAVVNGHPWGAEVLITDVWIKDKDAWRVVTRHTSPITRAKDG